MPYSHRGKIFYWGLDLASKLRCVFTACSFPAACTGVAASLACAAGVARSAAMSKPGLQARAAAQAGAHVDINVHVTTDGAAAAASASAQPNVQRPESKQPNIAGFFSKRAAPTGSEPEMVGAAGTPSRRARRPWSTRARRARPHRLCPLPAPEHYFRPEPTAM